MVLQTQVLKLDPKDIEDAFIQDAIRIGNQEFISTIKKSPDDSVKTIQALVPSVNRNDFTLDSSGTLIIANKDLKEYLLNNPQSPIFTQGCNNCQCQTQNTKC